MENVKNNTNSQKSKGHQLKTFNLDDCVQVVKEKDESGKLVIYGFDFYLNSQLIAIAKAVQQGNSTIKISNKLLNYFRYYALFGQGKSLDMGIIFCTFYQKNHVSQGVIRSFISLDGDIIQQVCDECLESPQLTLDIINIHYWLINCLIAELRLKISNKFDVISWLLSLLTVGGFGAVNLEQVQNLEPITYIFPIMMSWLFKQGFQGVLRLTIPRLGHWFVRQMLFGFFSKTQKMREIALNILGKISYQ